MWRGLLASCRYSFSCWSESLRPNQVFHQKRNGIRQISHAVRKKRSFWVRDMPGFRLCASAVSVELGLADKVVIPLTLLYDIGIEYAFLLQIVRDRILGQKRGLKPDFGSNPFA